MWWVMVVVVLSLRFLQNEGVIHLITLMSRPSQMPEDR